MQDSFRGKTMSRSRTSQLTLGQQEVLYRALARRGIPLPTDVSQVTDWLIDSGKLLSAANYIKKLLDESGPNPPELKYLEQRTVVLCAFNSFDPITMSRADALESFLEAFTDDPTILTDRKAFRALMRDINRVHERSLADAHAAINAAIQRFNDNIALGRPLVQCVENLFSELESLRVFCCFNRSDEVGKVFRDAWTNGNKYIEAARDGKTYPDNLVYPVVASLHEKLQEMYREESLYWYHEDTIRLYVRDTLIPHAIVNGYIEPSRTVDIYGSLWRLICDFRSDSSLLVCPLALFHQPRQLGPRYIGISELTSELQGREIDPRRFPHLEYRLSAKLQERRLDRCALTRIPFDHSFVRLTHTLDYVPYLLCNLDEPFARFAPTIESWLPTTFLAIDPGYGIAGRQARLIMSQIVDQVVSQSLRAPSQQQSDTYLLSFQEGFERTIENITAILREPIERFDGNPETPVDPFEVREALVKSALLGLYQANSDWEEEQAIAEAFTEAVSAAAKFELEPDAPINKLNAVEALEKLIAALRPFYLRVMQISFEPLAIELWVVLTCYSIATANSLRVNRLLDEDVRDDLLIPLNLPAFKEALAGKAGEILLDICRRIHEVSAPQEVA